NVNVDSTRFRNNLENAHSGAVSEGNPLAPGYNKQTFGGNGLVEAQHVIPVSVANDDLNVQFFKNLRTETEKSPGGAYVFKINDVQNGIFLPTSSAAAATGQQQGIYAAVKSIAPFDHYSFSIY
ncbi:hypothetical protein, partial [Flavobacterium sp.]|uniref:hypothetical protein n=1 Tax=Flavobacterium sp. TaxID=239 RepID=UPI0025C6C751